MNNFLSMDKRLELFKSRLTQDEYNIYVYGMAKEVQPIVEEKLKMIDNILASSTMAALTDTYDLSLEECQRIMDKVSEYMKEDSEIANKYKEEYSDMIDKKEPAIREEIRKELKNKAGEQKTDICKRIAHKFDVCVSDVVVLYTDEKLKFKGKYATQNKKRNDDDMSKIEKRKEKEELKAKVTERCKFYIEQGKSQIFTVAQVAKELNTTRTDVAIIYKSIRKEQKAKLEQKKAYTETEEARQTITLEDTKKALDEELSANKGTIKENPFKVISQTVKLEGKYGIYVRSSDGVQAGQVHFSKKEDVDKYEQAEIGQMDKNIEVDVTKRQAQIDELQAEIDELYKSSEAEKEEFKQKTEEIRQVFDYGKAM